MAAIAQLKAVLGLDNKQYKANMKDSEGAAKRFQKNMAGIGRSMAAAFSVGAIIGATKRLVDFASEIRHTADNLQVSTDALQGLNALSLRYGLTVDNIGRALSKMAIAQGQVKGGGDEAKRYMEALDKLRIAHEEFTGLSTAQALEVVGKAYNEAEDQTVAFTAVADILGQRIGPRLTAMLQELGDTGLQTVIDQAKKAGSVIESELLTKLELVGTRADEAKLRLTVGLAQGLGAIGEAIHATADILGQMSAGESFSGAFQNQQDEMMADYFSRIERKWEQDQARKAAEAAEAAEREAKRKAAAEREAKRKADAQAREAKRRKDEVNRLADAQAREAKRRKDEVNRLNERFGGAIARETAQEVSAGGTGQNVSGIARMGGAVGASRAGLGIADRQLRMQIASNEKLQRIADLEERAAEAMEALLEEQAARTGIG